MKGNLCFLVVFAISSLAFIYLNIDINSSLIIVIIPAVLPMAVGIIFFNYSNPKIRTGGILLILLGIGIIFGISCRKRMDIARKYQYLGIEQNNITGFKGNIIQDSIVTQDGDYIHYVALTHIISKQRKISAQAHGKVIIYATQGKRYFTGEIINVEGKLLINDNLSPYNFYTSINKDSVTTHGFSSDIFKLRAFLLFKLEQQIEYLDDDAAGFFKAILLGNKEDLPLDIYHSFRKSGSLHILALSGLHVGIIFALISIIILPIPKNWLKIIIGSIFILFYLFLVGPKPSLLRATLMVILGGICLLFKRDMDLLNILCIALIIILFFDPFSAYSLSFQLSFLALFGIITVGRKINYFLFPYVPSFISLPLSIAFGAQLLTAPLVLITFGEIYPIGIIVSLFIIPLVAVYIWSGLIFLLISSFSLITLTLLLTKIINILYEIIFYIVKFFSIIPGIKLEWHNWYWLIFFIFVGIILFHVPGKANRT